MFEGIFTLPAAHSMRLSAQGEITIERYGDVTLSEESSAPGTNFLEETEALLRQAVKLAMRSDVPVGGYLSAGVDSFHKVTLLTERYTQLMPRFLHDHLAMPALRAMPVDLLTKFFVFPAKLGQQGKARLVDFMGNYRDRNLFENYIALKTLWPREERAAAYTAAFKSLAADAWIPSVRDEGGTFLTVYSRFSGTNGCKIGALFGRTKTPWRIPLRCGCPSWIIISLTGPLGFLLT